MITTKRANGYGFYQPENNKGGIALLERTDSPSYNANIVEDDAQIKEKMQRNLDRLLNYEKYDNVLDSVSANVVEKTDVESATQIKNEQNEDTMPTSTTMQFGTDGEIEQILNEIKDSRKKEQATYRLNSKGKLVVVLYALAVTVILALIVLNSGILSTLRNVNAQKVATVNDLASTYSKNLERIEEISSEDYVIDKAINELGMVLA